MATFPGVDEEVLLARLVRPFHGRGLVFHVQPGPRGGVRIIVPNLIQAPRHGAFRHLHQQVLQINAGIRGRLVIDEDGRVHYDLGLQTVETPSGGDLERILEILESDIERAHRTLLIVGMASLLPIEIATAERMVDSLEEEADESAPAGAAEGESTRLVI